MERLVKRIGEYMYYTQGKYPETIPAEMSRDDIRNVLRKLADYEDAEEQGLLLRLPCPIGTKVYTIDYECEGDYYNCHHCCDICAWNVADVYVRIFDTWMCDDFGKIVFLTKEEAEQKLAEIRGE